jgi:Leucine-rich repeat (LRR) protein
MQQSGSNKLFGELPKKIVSLPNLVHVDLSMNALRGSTPVFTSSALESVNLSHNRFDGKLPEDVGKKMSGATVLKVFDLKYNSITGSIPHSIGSMPASLKQLDLSDNMLTGTIPESIGNLVLLEGLFLSNNRLSGRIPLSITRSHLMLSQLFLQGNKLTG